VKGHGTRVIDHCQPRQFWPQEGAKISGASTEPPRAYRRNGEDSVARIPLRLFAAKNSEVELHLARPP